MDDLKIQCSIPDPALLLLDSLSGIEQPMGF
jgi:hypothetical protein